MSRRFYLFRICRKPHFDANKLPGCHAGLRKCVALLVKTLPASHGNWSFMTVFLKFHR